MHANEEQHLHGVKHLDESNCMTGGWRIPVVFLAAKCAELSSVALICPPVADAGFSYSSEVLANPRHYKVTEH
jgi:hypothetical protein